MRRQRSRGSRALRRARHRRRRAHGLSFRLHPDAAPGGRLADFGSATQLIKWGRRLAWLVGPLTGITLAGYIALYAATSGRFCTARLNHREQAEVIIWAWVAALTFVALATSAILRARARKLGGTPGPGGVRRK